MLQGQSPQTKTQNAYSFLQLISRAKNLKSRKCQSFMIKNEDRNQKWCNMLELLLWLHAKLDQTVIPSQQWNEQTFLVSPVLFIHQLNPESKTKESNLKMFKSPRSMLGKDSTIWDVKSVLREEQKSITKYW